eukprot:m.204699 g.204699  ORF g.204699 m.204699 type:complete len:160 (+) comp13742_c0_seq9:170-649(+)
MQEDASTRTSSVSSYSRRTATSSATSYMRNTASSRAQSQVTSVSSTYKASPSIDSNSSSSSAPLKRNTSDERLRQLNMQRNQVKKQAKETMSKVRRNSDALEQEKIIMEATATITTQKLKNLERSSKERRRASQVSFTYLLFHPLSAYVLFYDYGCMFH